MSVVRYGYLQARIQARHGRLPDERLWARLETTDSPAHFLASVRNTPLRPWVTNVGPDSDAHTAERAIHRHFRDEVEQVAGWYPEEWRPAAAWVGAFVDLPLLRHLLSTAPPPAWLREEPRLRPFAADLLEVRERALAESRFAPLVEAHRRGVALADAWTDQWRRLWPADLPHGQTETLMRLIDLFAGQRGELAGGTLADSRPARGALAAALTRLFRRRTHQPAAGFIYLALAGLAAERLRGNLARLLLFGSDAEGAA